MSCRYTVFYKTGCAHPNRSDPLQHTIPIKSDGTWVEFCIHSDFGASIHAFDHIEQFQAGVGPMTYGRLLEQPRFFLPFLEKGLEASESVNEFEDMSASIVGRLNKGRLPSTQGNTHDMSTRPALDEGPRTGDSLTSLE